MANNRLTLRFLVVIALFPSTLPIVGQSVTFNRTDIPTGGNPQAVGVADFNNDGIPDIASLGSSGGTVSILLGNGDGTFKPELTTNVTTFPKAFAIADFNNDGKADLIINIVLS